MTDEKIERGAAEERSGSPLTPTEVQASRTPPSTGGSDAVPEQATDEHDKADSASDTDV
jgi:hypothetical protein